MELLKTLWTTIGEAGHIALYNVGITLVALLITKIPGPVGVILKKLIDALSANLEHKPPSA